MPFRVTASPRLAGVRSPDERLHSGGLAGRAWAPPECKSLDRLFGSCASGLLFVNEIDGFETLARQLEYLPARSQWFDEVMILQKVHRLARFRNGAIALSED